MLEESLVYVRVNLTFLFKFKSSLDITGEKTQKESV